MPTTTAVKPKSKVKIADLSVNEKVQILLQLASSAPKQTFKEAKSSSKLFELVVLADVLGMYASVHGAGTVRVRNAKPNTLSFAGAPASANKGVFSYFELLDSPGGAVQQEAWVSVEVETLSWHLASIPPPVPRSGKHEVDVAIFEPLTVPYPPHNALHAGFSCKHFQPLKECVREALGLRRETAFLSPAFRSKVPWLISAIPAKPASALYLVSSSAGVYAYQDPVWSLGVYMMCVPFTD